MDYGKEAYYKATELESRVTTLANNTLTTNGLTVSSGGDVATYTGGSALIAVSVSSTGSGEIIIYFAGGEKGRIQAGGSGSFVFAVTSSGVVRLEVPEGVTLTSANISALGVSTSFTSEGTRIVADGSGNRIFAATSENGVTVYSYDGSKFAKVAQLAGSNFDIAVTDSHVFVATVLGDNVAVLKLNGSVIEASYMVSSAKMVTLISDGTSLILAEYDGNKVTAKRLTYELYPIDSTRTHSSSSVTALSFVRNSQPPVLGLTDSGKTLIRKMVQEICVAPDYFLTVKFITV